MYEILLIAGTAISYYSTLRLLRAAPQDSKRQKLANLLSATDRSGGSGEER